MHLSGGTLDFKSYVINVASEGTVGTFSLSGGTGTSSDNVLDPAGTYAFNGSYSFAPSDTIVLTSTFTSGTVSQIKSITFSTPVPEPSTYELAAVSTGVIGLISRRCKARRA